VHRTGTQARRPLFVFWQQVAERDEMAVAWTRRMWSVPWMDVPTTTGQLNVVIACPELLYTEL